MSGTGITGLILIVINGIVSYKGFTNPLFFDGYKFEVDRVLINKDYLRLLTSGFLHVNWGHLVFNMLSLYFFSGPIENNFSSFQLLLIYFTSLIGGNLLTLFVHRNHGEYSSVGASGAVCGIIFASIALFPGFGIGFFAMVISYLPVLYQSFSRREVNISMLDARAGTPPTAGELLRRHHEAGDMESLNQLLKDWEKWSADLLESHLSYPVLCYFRSQHDNQSWLSALSTILDTCALVMVGVDGIPKWQAQLTFKMTRHAIVDLTQVFNTSPLTTDGQRLTSQDLGQLRSALAEAGVLLSNDEGNEQTLAELREMYEPYLAVLSAYLLMPIPGWLPKKRVVDNWQTSAWEVTKPAREEPFRKCMLEEKRAAKKVAAH